MTVSRVVWIVLAVSIAVALVIMVAAFVIMRKKIKKVQAEYTKNEADIKQEINKALERMNHGELLWELKSKSLNPLEDTQLEYLINTVLRNNYKTFNVVNSESNYETQSLTKIAKAKASKVNPDFTMIFSGKDLNNLFDKAYKTLKPKQMIAITNAIRREKEIKEMMKYLRLIGAKYEWVNYGKGILLVVK